MKGCESWTIKKAECWRIDAFELWCWRRLLWVPWTARRSILAILKVIRSWIFLGGTDAEAEAPILWPLMWRTDSLEKTWCWERLIAEEGTTENEMVGWNHWFNGHEFEQALGVGDGQRSLAYCSPWGFKALDMTEQLNWTERSSTWVYLWETETKTHI